eukprot:5878881-Pyramimonas_sp.AAC.1
MPPVLAKATAEMAYSLREHYDKQSLLVQDATRAKAAAQVLEQKVAGAEGGGSNGDNVTSQSNHGLMVKVP